MALFLNTFLSPAEIADATSGLPPTMDCSAHFQNAANAAKANGDKLIVSAGRYWCSNISLYNVALEGAGTIDLGYESGTVGSLAHSGTSFWCQDTTNSLFNVQSGCTLRGFSIYYPNQTGAAFTANSNTPTTYPPSINILTNSENILLEDVGCTNAYQFLQIGSMSNTNAVGRITLRGLRVYSIFCDIYVDVLRDILNLEDCSFTFGWWDQSECGTVDPNGTVNNLATWTAINGRSFIIETTDGIAASNCFWFAKASVLQVVAGSEMTGSVGQSQYNRFTNCLFDGCSSPVQAVFGGYWTSTTFTNCIFASLNGVGYQGTYPYGGIGFDSTVTSGGSMGFIGCEFIGASGNLVRLVHPMATVTFSGCYFEAWGRYSSSTQIAAIYISDSTSKVLIDGCTFDASGGTVANRVAIDCEKCASLVVTNCAIGNAYTPIAIGAAAAGSILVSGVYTYGTGGSISVLVAAGSTSTLTLDASNQLDKPPSLFGSALTSKVDAGGSSTGTIGAGPTNLTFTTKSLDTLSAFIASTGTFTAPYSARFRVSLMVTHTTAVTAGNAWKLAINVNGTTRVASIYQVFAAQEGTHRINADVSLTAGQTMTFPMSRQAGSGNFPVVSGDTTLVSLQIAAIE